MGTYIDWLSQNSWLIGALTAGSLLAMILSIMATPWIIASLPRDYFLQRIPGKRKHPMLQLLIDTLRTILGGVLILIGLIMIIAPGPGLLVMLIGLSSARFPGKRQLVKRVVSHESVFSSLNWMRHRAGKEPLLHPSQSIQA